jgi:hypothetical protein
VSNRDSKRLRFAYLRVSSTRISLIYAYWAKVGDIGHHHTTFITLEVLVETVMADGAIDDAIQSNSFFFIKYSINSSTVGQD